MFDFLNFNNPFVAGVYRVANMIVLSLVWLLFCIPIFTIGASTTAMYYCMQKVIRNDRDYVWSCFWDGFKKNFRQSTLIWLIFLAVGAVMLTDLSIIQTLEDMEKLAGNMKIVFAVILVVMLIYAFWVFACQARFENTLKATMRNTAVMMVCHLPAVVMTALIAAGFVLLIWLMPIIILIVPAVCVFFMSYFTERVFRSHMTEEEKRKDDEINMQWHNDYEDVPDGSGARVRRRRGRK